MTIKAIRENLEDARDNGITYKIGDMGMAELAGRHEAKLYSICEGLIVEIERLQARVDDLVRPPSHVEQIMRVLGDATEGTVDSGLAQDIANRALKDACSNLEGK